MKDTGRALRRHHRRRMIMRALKSFSISHIDEEYRLQWALRRYDNLQECSCHMCGHRRKWNGLTFQELRMHQRGEYYEED